MRRTRLVRLLAAPAGGTAEGPSHPATSAAMLLEGSMLGVRGRSMRALTSGGDHPP